MIMPGIMPKGFNKAKYNKLSENEKYLYCMIESLFVRYLCDEITIQTFITKVINESKNHLTYEQSSL